MKSKAELKNHAELDCDECRRFKKILEIIDEKDDWLWHDNVNVVVRNVDSLFEQIEAEIILLKRLHKGDRPLETILEGHDIDVNIEFPI